MKSSGKHFVIEQAHGGSSRQARAVISGELAADVVTLGLFSDVESLHKRGMKRLRFEQFLPQDRWFLEDEGRDSATLEAVRKAYEELGIERPQGAAEVYCLV